MRKHRISTETRNKLIAGFFLFIAVGLVASWFIVVLTEAVNAH